MRIALFDLDGTITRHDSLLPYVLGFCLRHPARLWRLLAMPGPLLTYACGGRDRGRLKESLIVAGLRGRSRTEFANWNRQFVATLIPGGVYPQALTRIAAHRAAGDHLILMTASPDLYVPAIALVLGFNETICTGLRWEGMYLNGELSTANRRGEEKLRCVEALRQRYPGCSIEAYGNAESDLLHLSACDRPHLVNPSSGAIRAAAARGVPVGWPLA